MALRRRLALAERRPLAAAAQVEVVGLLEIHPCLDINRKNRDFLPGHTYRKMIGWKGRGEQRMFNCTSPFEGVAPSFWGTAVGGDFVAHAAAVKAAINRIIGKHVYPRTSVYCVYLEGAAFTK